MRILFLRRDPSPELRRWSDELATAVSRLGYQARIVDADDWMPRETDPALNKETTKNLKDLADGFDIVHAFGFRTSWACSELFGDREVWLYTAYDLPKTTNSKLIDRLNMAQTGLCSSRAVMNVLEDAGAVNLEIFHPGVNPDLETLRERSDVREELGVPEGVFLVGTEDVDILESVRDRDMAMVIYGWERDETWPPNAMGVRSRTRPREIIGACDLWLSAGRGLGFSLPALDAMAMSVPVLARHEGGLIDIVSEDVTGQFFFDNEFLPDTLSVLADMDITREAYGLAARVRLQEMFSIQRCAQRLGDIYGEWA